MPFALNFFHDQIVAGGSSAPALPAAHRLLYVRYGRVGINGQTLNIDEALRRARNLTVGGRLESGLAVGARGAELDSAAIRWQWRIVQSANVACHHASSYVGWKSLAFPTRSNYRRGRSHRRSSPASRPRNSLSAGGNFQRRAGRGIGS